MKELELLSKLVSFDTQSHKTNKALVDYVAKLFIPRKKKLKFGHVIAFRLMD